MSCDMNKKAPLTGLVVDIKEGAIHDGPGIRQTVFLKGCPLSCKWCHNPEGLALLPELVISPSGCRQCGKCMAVCPKGPAEASPYRPESCDACGLCVEACPERIRRIAGERVTSQELAFRLMKNAAYYASVGGGVTFSGGEPLMQADFVIETLSLLGPGIHKAVETSGYSSPADFKAFPGAFDLIMMDLKLMDDALHTAYTCRSNRMILDNARTLCAGSTPFIIRIPVIPGVNDNEEHYGAVARLIAGAPSLVGVELLPYHKTAGAKYAMMGKHYHPGFDTGKSVYTDFGVFERYGMRSCVL